MIGPLMSSSAAKVPVANSKAADATARIDGLLNNILYLALVLQSVRCLGGGFLEGGRRGWKLPEGLPAKHTDIDPSELHPITQGL